jgi:hypothetical protein
MKEEYINSFNALFDDIYQGNNNAKKLSFDLLKIAHIWDDLIDRDKPVSDEDINEVFLMSIFEIHNNPLWFQCGLNHHVLNVFLRWRDATKIERDKSSTDNDLDKCYMMRAGIYDIFVVIAYHLHGIKWAAEVGPLVRRFYGEELSSYKEEVRQCQIQ